MNPICDRERAATPFVWAGVPRGPVAKICGLTRLEDIVAAWGLGAWALGFVFARSPRRLAPEAARRLIQDAVELAEAQSLGDHRPLMIGVFGDDSAGEVAETVIEAGLDGVQLHGSAGPSGSEVRAALDGRRRGLLIIQAVPVDPMKSDADTLRSAVTKAGEEADVVLLDTKTGDKFGGTGIPFCWRLARGLDGPLLLVAGGIGPDNVTDALAQSGAWGVDVSSGVELSPGIKDAVLMKRLFAQIGAVRDLAACAVPDGLRGSETREGGDERVKGTDR